MDHQAWEQVSDTDGRLRYVAAFLPIAWAGVNTMFTQPACQVESFGVDGDDTVHATTVVHYRGQRCTYRRQIWPPAHPAQLAAQMYTTFLEEILHTNPDLHTGRTEAVQL
jgi:hypothetical protein